MNSRQEINQRQIDQEIIQRQIDAKEKLLSKCRFDENSKLLVETLERDIEKLRKDYWRR